MKDMLYRGEGGSGVQISLATSTAATAAGGGERVLHRGEGGLVMHRTCQFIAAAALSRAGGCLIVSSVSRSAF